MIQKIFKEHPIKIIMACSLHPRIHRDHGLEFLCTCAHPQ